MLDVGAPIAVSVVYIRAGASPLPHYVAKLWANDSSGEPKGTTDAVKVEMEVTSSKDPGDVDGSVLQLPLLLLEQEHGVVEGAVDGVERAEDVGGGRG